MNIKELKKELNLSNADLAKCFDMTYGAYANSTAKERYENALLSFYKLAKKGLEKNKRKNLISDNQTIKHKPKPLTIHGVVVPKGTLCECDDEDDTIPMRWICTKCNKEWKP